MTCCVCDLLGVCHDVLHLCRCDFWGLSFCGVCVSCDLLGVCDCVVSCCMCAIDDLLGVCQDVLQKMYVSFAEYSLFYRALLQSIVSFIRLFFIDDLLGVKTCCTCVVMV